MGAGMHLHVAFCLEISGRTEWAPEPGGRGAATEGGLSRRVSSSVVEWADAAGRVRFFCGFRSGDMEPAATRAGGS